MTSDHCRVTVQRLFSKILPVAWYIGKQLFDSRLMVASPPTWLERLKNVVWRSADCHVTVRLLCSHSFFLVRLHILPCRCISRCSTFSSSIFPPKAWPRISSYSNGLILEIFDIVSKLGIGRREILILAGKFQLDNSLWGKQVPHYKHRRRSTTYLLREIPVKNRESWSRGSTHGKIVG